MIPPAIVIPADRVAEAGCRWHGHQVVLGSLGAHGDAGARPERQRIVGALVGVGPPLPLPVPRT